MNDQLRIFDVRPYMRNYHRADTWRRIGEVRGIAIHHSATANFQTGEPAGDAHSFSSYHVDGLGWDHGAYHYVIKYDGRIEYALDESIASYHAGFEDPHDYLGLSKGQYWNNHYISICLVGWFEDDRRYVDAMGYEQKIPRQHFEPSSAQMQSLALLVRYLQAKYSIPLAKIQRHRDLKGCETVCPGSNFNLSRFLEDLGGLESDGSTIQKVEVFFVPDALKSSPLKKVFRSLLRQLLSSMNTILHVGTKGFLVLLLPAISLLLGQELTAIQAVVLTALIIHLLFALMILSLRWYNPPMSAYMRAVRASLRAENLDDLIQQRWVNLKEMPASLVLAALEAEDSSFLKHHGFDLWMMWRAWRSNRVYKTRKGQSTITQQLARNLFLWPRPTYIRKTIEFYIAAYMEVLLSKQRILELYLNVIQFDKNVFGVGAAAVHYFNKEARDLTVEESALLMAVVPNPHVYRVETPSAYILRRKDTIIERVFAKLDSFRISSEGNLKWAIDEQTLEKWRRG